MSPRKRAKALGLVDVIRELRGSKTFWLSIVVILGAAEEWARDPSVTGREALGVVAAGLALLFMRHAVEKSGPLPPTVATVSSAAPTTITTTATDAQPEKEPPK